MAEYFCSDLHGEYDLFMRLLDVCKIGSGDTVYVLGDMIDKGKKSFRLLDFIAKQKNFRAICGNHEYALLKIYQDQMKQYDGSNDEVVLNKIRKFYPNDGEELTWELLDYVDALPFYIETEKCICVHAGVELDDKGKIVPLKKQNPNVFLFDRKFKEANVVPNGEKVVLFGHTPCSYDNESGKFIKTPRTGVLQPRGLSAYAKIRLDTGVAFTGMLGMLRTDDMEEMYVF